MAPCFSTRSRADGRFSEALFAQSATSSWIGWPLMPPFSFTDLAHACQTCRTGSVTFAPMPVSLLMRPTTIGARLAGPLGVPGLAGSPEPGVAVTTGPSAPSTLGTNVVKESSPSPAALLPHSQQRHRPLPHSRRVISDLERRFPHPAASNVRAHSGTLHRTAVVIAQAPLNPASDRRVTPDNVRPVGTQSQGRDSADAGRSHIH